MYPQPDPDLPRQEEELLLNKTLISLESNAHQTRHDNAGNQW